jgi:hypothetical protein
MRFSSPLFAVALLFSSAAFAEDSLKLDLAAKSFGPQKAAVLNAINVDQKYSEIELAERNAVIKALERISEMLSDEKPFSSIDAVNREHVLADQQLINSALEQAKRDSKMICAKEAVIGSNLPKRICKTAAARNRDNAKLRSQNGTEISQ